MASLLPAYNLGTATLPCKKTRICQVKAQMYRDHQEGRSGDMVDGNLCVLRVRIEAAMKKERLERCFVAGQGWNYTPLHSFKAKRNIDNEIIHEFVQIVGMVGALLASQFSAAAFAYALLPFSFT